MKSVPKSYTDANLFTTAIVRTPSATFATGLTSVDLGKPDYELTLSQHHAYCQALEACGLELMRLPADERHPDSTFVEDTAIVTERGAVITRPGAPSRRGEIESVESALRAYHSDLKRINEPGTLDGGDICQCGSHFFIGLSGRTNEAGGGQLAEILEAWGYSCSLIDIRRVSNILHLKSGMAYLGGNRLVVTEALSRAGEFSSYELVHVKSTEEYAANCLFIDGCILVAAGFPDLKRQIEELNYRTIAVDMSEFQKMDGGLSCLSLRF